MPIPHKFVMFKCVWWTVCGGLASKDNYPADNEGKVGEAIGALLNQEYGRSIDGSGSGDDWLAQFGLVIKQAGGRFWYACDLGDRRWQENCRCHHWRSVGSWQRTLHSFSWRVGGLYRANNPYSFDEIHLIG